MIEHPPGGTGKPEETTESKNQTKAVVFTTENPAIGMGIPVEFTWQPNLQPIPRLETPGFSPQEETFEQKALRQEFKTYREDHKGFDGQRVEMFKLYNGILAGAAIGRRNPQTSAKTLDELESWYQREKKRFSL